MDVGSRGQPTFSSLPVGEKGREGVWPRETNIDEGHYLPNCDTADKVTACT